MFRPVKLTRVMIQIPEDQASGVMAVLGELRLLHLIRVEETHLGRLGYVARIDVDSLQRYETLLTRADRLVQELSPLGLPPPPGPVQRPDRAIYPLEEALQAIEESERGPLERLKGVRDAISDHQALITRLRFLEPAALDFDRLEGLRYVTWQAGLLPQENLERLEESLADVYHALVPVGREGQRIVLVAMALKEDEALLVRALKSAFWEPLSLPKDLKGPVTEVLERLEAELQTLNAELSGLESERKRFAELYGTKLLGMREEILLAKQLLRAQAFFGQIDHSFLLTGWVPVDLFEELKAKVLDVTGGKALVERVDPEEIREVRSGILKIPILFNNPVLIRPFERLTALYGTPSYEEVEPTVFLAVSFLVLFGMMFGDVGHGLVLCGVGYFIFRKMYRYMDYGVILMECGVASMVFGFLYGSVFGLEDLVPALWMRPMANIGRFIGVAALLGVGMISLGLLLNLVNVIRQRRYEDLFSGSGLAGALVYWLGAGLGARYLMTGRLRAFEITVAATVGSFLLLVMVLSGPVKAWLASRRGGRRPPGEARGPDLGMSLFESLVEVLDDLLRYLANTVSFVRVAAFGLTHAGLFMAVFSLADAVGHLKGGGLFYWLTVAFGNVVIIVLEGVVVSIQTIRLEYYEFFSKFFRGGGEPFRPLVESEGRGTPAKR